MIKHIKDVTNTEDKKRLLSNFFSLSALQIFTYVLPLLTLPYLVRVLGVEKFGLVMFAQAFLIFFNLLVEYGFILSATRDISIHRGNKDKITEIFSSVMIIQSILLIISFVILTIVLFSFKSFSAYINLYYLTFLTTVGQLLFPIWYFQGMEQMKYITIVNIISKLFFTVLIFIVIKNPGDYIYVPLINGLGFIIGGIISLWMIHKNFNQIFKFYSFNILKKYFIDSTQYFISRITNVGNENYLIFIIGVMFGNTIVGYFSMVEKLYKAYFIGIQPLVQTIYPNMSKNKNISFFKKVYFPATMFFAFISIVLMFYAKEFLFLFYGITNETINSIFYILFTATFFGITNVLIGYPLLGAMGFVKEANYGNIYGALVSFLYTTICYLLKVDVTTIVFALLINEIVSVFYRGLKVKRYILNNKGK